MAGRRPAIHAFNPETNPQSLASKAHRNHTPYQPAGARNPIHACSSSAAAAIVVRSP